MVGPPPVGLEDLPGEGAGRHQRHVDLAPVEAGHRRRGDVAVAAVLAQAGGGPPQGQVGRRGGGQCGVGGEEGAPGAVGLAHRATARSAARARLGSARVGPSRRPNASSIAPSRASRIDAGVAKLQASGIERATMAGAKLKKVAATTAGPTGPIGADRPAK